MKCSNCGKTKFYNRGNPSCYSREGDFFKDDEIVQYICMNCGHIELFVTKECLNEMKEQNKREIEIENLREKLISKIEQLKTEIEFRDNY